MSKSVARDEIEADSGPLPRGFFGRYLRKQTRSYVYYQGQSDEWGLVGHAVSIRATAIKKTDHSVLAQLCSCQAMLTTNDHFSVP